MGQICTIAYIHKLYFLPAYLDTMFGGFFLDNIETSSMACNFITEEGGVISILQVCQMVVSQSDSCDPLADLSYNMID